MELLGALWLVLGLAFGLALRVPLVAAALAKLSTLPADFAAEFAAEFVALPDTLYDILWVDLAFYVEFFFWARDFISHRWLLCWNTCVVFGGCWYYLCGRPRYWAFFPFRCFWIFLVQLHMHIWPQSSRYPTEKGFSWTQVFSLVLHTRSPTRFPNSFQNENENTNEATNADIGEGNANGTLGKAYKGPRVKRGPRSNKSGLIQPVNGKAPGLSDTNRH